MPHYINSAVLVQDDLVTGNSDQGAPVKVYFHTLPTTQVEAPLFSDKELTVPLPQPVLSKTMAQANPGRFDFYVADGHYDIVINEGSANPTFWPDISISDKSVFYLSESETISSKTLRIGDTVFITDRLNASGQVVDGETPNGFDIIELTGSDLYWKYIDNGSVKAAHLGMPTGGDDTLGFVALNNLTKSFKLQAGTYLIDNFTPLEGTTVETDGFDTIIQQNSGILTDTRVILIVNNDVSIGDIHVIGNISTDTGEQRHAISIRAETQDVERINLGNIKGVNLRGDVLALFGNTSFNVKNVNFGDVFAENCLRQGVTITSGDIINGGFIRALDVGLFVLDIEPDTAGGIVNKVDIKGVEGRQCGILGEPSDGVVKDISIGKMVLDGSLGRSTPPFGVFGNDKNGLVGRNTRGVTIDSLTIKNQLGSAMVGVFSGLDVACGDWHIKRMILDSNNTDASDTNILTLSSWDSIKIDRIESTATDVATELLMIGDSGATKRTRVELGSVKCDTKLCSFMSINCGYSDISYSANVNCAQSLYKNSVFTNAIWDVGRISGFNTGEITFISSDLTFTGSSKYDASVGTAWNAIEINTRVTDTVPTTTWTAMMVNNVAQITP